MRKLLLLAALALVWPASPAWSQAVAHAQNADAVKRSPKPVKKASSKRHEDARHCLQQPTNDAIIRCAEEYL